MTLTIDAAPVRSRAPRRRKARAAKAVVQEKFEALRDEARMLTLAGIMLMAVGLPVTLALVAVALPPGGLTPLAPIAFGGGPVLLGYLACFMASHRLTRARRIAQEIGA